MHATPVEKREESVGVHRRAKPKPPNLHPNPTQKKKGDLRELEKKKKRGSRKTRVKAETTNALLVPAGSGRHRVRDGKRRENIRGKKTHHREGKREAFFIYVKKTS